MENIFKSIKDRISGFFTHVGKTAVGVEQEIVKDSQAAIHELVDVVESIGTGAKADIEWLKARVEKLETELGIKAPAPTIVPNPTPAPDNTASQSDPVKVPPAEPAPSPVDPQLCQQSN